MQQVCRLGPSQSRCKRHLEGQTKAEALFRIRASDSVLKPKFELKIWAEANKLGSAHKKSPPNGHDLPQIPDVSHGIILANLDQLGGYSMISANNSSFTQLWHDAVVTLLCTMILAIEYVAIT